MGERASGFKEGYETAAKKHAYDAGKEAAKTECEAAKRYGTDQTPDLTPGRVEQLLATHNKKNSDMFMKGYYDGWRVAGGELSQDAQ